MPATQTAKRAANVLMTVYSDIWPESEVVFDPSQEWHYRRSPADVNYVIGSKARVVVQKASAIVFGGSDYPSEAAGERLLRIVLSAKDIGLPASEVCRKLADDINAMMQTMTILGEWKYLTVVSGFDLQCGPMQVGQCRILQLDQRTLDELQEQFHKSDPEKASSIWNSASALLFAKLIGQQAAIVNVQAVDAEHATALAQLAIQESLNVWCYGQAAIEKYSGCCLFPQAKWPTTPVGTSHRLLRLDTPALPATESSGPAAGLPLVVVQDAPGWPAMLCALETPAVQRTEISSRALTAAQWCANAAFANVDSVRLISLATALEAVSMLSNEFGGKRRKIKKRLSLLLGSDTQDRQSISNDVESIYVCRNECLHNGRHHVEPELFAKAMTLLSRTVAVLTSDQRFSAMTTLREVVDWVNSQ